MVIFLVKVLMIYRVRYDSVSHANPPVNVMSLIRVVILVRSLILVRAFLVKNKNPRER